MIMDPPTGEYLSIYLSICSPPSERKNINRVFFFFTVLILIVPHYCSFWNLPDLRFFHSVGMSYKGIPKDAFLLHTALKLCAGRASDIRWA